MQYKYSGSKKLPHKWHFIWPLSEAIKKLYINIQYELIHTNLEMEWQWHLDTQQGR